VIILKQEDLTKFGYRSKTKLKIILKPGYTLATCKNLWSKYGDFNLFFPSKYGDFDFGRLFFPKESFVTSSDFFFFAFSFWFFQSFFRI